MMREIRFKDEFLEHFILRLSAIYFSVVSNPLDRAWELEGAIDLIYSQN